MRPFCARFVIRASFVAPELRHAMLIERAFDGLELLRERMKFGRKGRVESVRRNKIRRSLGWTGGAVVEGVLMGGVLFLLRDHSSLKNSEAYGCGKYSSLHRVDLLG
jgi:hypothetical protein